MSLSVTRKYTAYGNRLRMARRVSPRTSRNCIGLSARRSIVSFQRCAELGAKPEPATFVPVSRFECFGLSLRPEADAAAHSRSSSFRRTSSQGIEDSGR